MSANSKLLSLGLGTLLLVSYTTARAQAASIGRPSLAFVTIEEGQKLLTQRDEFIERLSPFDRSARMKTSETVSEEAFLRFVSTNVLAWTDAEMAAIREAMANIECRLIPLALPWPDPIFMVKTSGREEARAAYTRGNAIVLPTNRIAAANSLPGLLGHELFHVLSRSQPKLREKLYDTIGFRPCQEVPYPPTLKEIRITNPDGPRTDYAIKIQFQDRSTWAVPIIYSRSSQYDAARKNDFFDYIEFRFLLVERAGVGNPPAATYEAANPVLANPNQISGFYEQVGRNTGYIIHPDEILAEHFRLLVTGQTNLRSPELIEKMRRAFQGE